MKQPRKLQQQVNYLKQKVFFSIFGQNQFLFGFVVHDGSESPTQNRVIEVVLMS